MENLCNDILRLIFRLSWTNLVKVSEMYEASGRLCSKTKFLSVRIDTEHIFGSIKNDLRIFDFRYFKMIKIRKRNRITHIYCYRRPNQKKRIYGQGEWVSLE
jgi:hypothetical protein